MNGRAVLVCVAGEIEPHLIISDLAARRQHPPETAIKLWQPDGRTDLERPARFRIRAGRIEEYYDIRLGRRARFRPMRVKRVVALVDNG